MKYIIYTPASKAEIRYSQITEDAKEANFLPEDGLYNDIIYHPTDDSAALEIVFNEGIYYNDMPVKSLDFGIFFTDNERAKALLELPNDWLINNI